MKSQTIFLTRIRKQKRFNKNKETKKEKKKEKKIYQRTKKRSLYWYKPNA